MSVKLRQLILSLAIPLAVGGLSAYLTMGSMESFESLRQPPLSPPGWLFPVVWTVLFLLMGFASYLVVRAQPPHQVLKRALILYGIQLGVNFFWSILFFNLGLYLVSFFWLILLWCAIVLTTLQFFSIRRLAGALMLPYLVWVTFAGYLNFAIFWLNR